jgi:hypothetical protein
MVSDFIRELRVAGQALHIYMGIADVAINSGGRERRMYWIAGAE